MQKIVMEATWKIKGNRNRKEETTDSTQNESILITEGINPVEQEISMRKLQRQESLLDGTRSRKNHHHHNSIDLSSTLETIESNYGDGVADATKDRCFQ